MSNCLVTGAQRGVNAQWGTSITVVNSTLDGNDYGILPHGGHVTIANSIISNSKTAGIWNCCSLAPTVSYTDIWTTVAGAVGYSSMSDQTGVNGNIASDPIFMNQAQGDFRLNYGSPAIDAADGAVAPATDAAGNARYSDPRTTTKKGVAAANGVYPDMGYREFVESSASDIDLVSTQIQGPTSAIAGQTANITYTIRNIGAGSATGPWHDAVYLVRDPDTNPVEIYAGEFLAGSNTTLGPGASYTNTVSLRVPGSVLGNHRWEVKANSRGEVFEGQNYGNNTSTSAATVAIDLQEIVLDGSAIQGTATQAGELFWYKFSPTTGTSAQIKFQLTGKTGVAQMFVAQGYMPDDETFDEDQQEWNSYNATVSLAASKGQTYYVAAYVPRMSSATAPFSIAAVSTPFGLTSISPTSITNGSIATVEFIGSQLTSSVSYQLVASNGTIFTASSVYLDDSAHAFARFDTSAMSAGKYDAQVTSNGTTAKLSSAIQVTSSTGSGTLPIASDVEYSLEVPSAVRAGFGGYATVHYKNVSGHDLNAPLMTLSTSGASTTFLSPVCSGCSANYASLYSSMAGQGQMLGVNPTGLAGTLQAGAEGSISLYFNSATSGSSVNFQLYAVNANSGSINWSNYKTSMQPSYIANGAWDAIFANFTNAVGSTWASYNSALAADASYLSQIGQTDYKISTLQSFEFEKAGLDTIAHRYHYGSFGYGPSHAMDIWAESRGSGWLIHYPNGDVRPFLYADGTVLVPIVLSGTISTSSATKTNYVGGMGDHGSLSYDSSSKLLTLTERGGTVLTFAEATLTPAKMLLSTVKDSNGNTATMTYANDKPVTIKLSDGDSSTIAYNSSGLIIQTTDSVGRVTSYAYDSAGTHLTTVTTPQGATSFTYVTGQGAASEHAVQSVTFPDSTHVYYEYDAQGRLSKSYQDGGASTVTYAYDTNGIVAVTDAKGNTTHLYPNANGVVAVVLDARGYTAQSIFDGEGKLTRLISPDGTEENYQYDANSNPSRYLDAGGNTTATKYDVNENLLSLSDPLGNGTDFAYDSAYNMLSITYPNEKSEQAQYDLHGNLTKWTNRRGTSITFTYNSFNQITQKTYSTGAQVNYSYDGHRNLSMIQDQRGTTAFSYDTADRLLQVTYPNGRYVKYSYDTGGRRASIGDQTGFSVKYSYDAAGRLSQLSTGSGTLLASYT